MVDEVVDRGVALAQEGREEVDAHHAAGAGDAADVLVGEVAVVVAQRSRGGVGGHDRPGGDLQDVRHARVAEVADVVDHAEPLHQPDRLDPGPGQAAPGGVLGAAVGERRPAEVGERGDPDAEAEERAEELDVRVHARGALEGQDQRDPPRPERPGDLDAVQAEGHVVRVGLGDPVRALDHPQRLPQRTLGPEVVVDEHRQDLEVDAARAQLGQPALGEERAPHRRRPGGHGHQQVVVGVRHDRRAVQVLRGRGHGSTRWVARAPKCR